MGIIEIAKTFKKIAMHLSFGLRGISVPRPGKLSLHGKNGTRSLLTKQQSISISHPLLFPSINSQVKLDIILQWNFKTLGENLTFSSLYIYKKNDSHFIFLTWTELRKSSPDSRKVTPRQVTFGKRLISQKSLTFFA